MKKIGTFLFALLILVACTPDYAISPGDPFSKKQCVTITARVDSDRSASLPGKHKVSGKDNGSTIKLTWDKGDEILIDVNGKKSVFELTKGAETAVGSFTGEMPAAGTSYTAVYPVEYDETVLDNQTYVENGFGKGLIKMSTKQPGTVNEGFVMSADNSVLILQLIGTQKIGEIILTNTLTGKFYVLDCDGVELDSSIPTLFHIVLPAGDWTRGFVVDVFDDSDKYIACFTKMSAAKFVAAESMVMPIKEITTMEAYKGIGVFSVSATKQVCFAPGNLQYIPSKNLWRFAPDQTITIGKPNENLSETYNGWVDLFGYSVASNNFGAITSPYASNYTGDFVDWGLNTIGVDIPDTWHTLSPSEWSYMINSRAKAASLYGFAQVDGINGAIIFPDNWSNPMGMPIGYGKTDKGFAINTFTYEKWKLLEQEGAIFLPLSGQRVGTNVEMNTRYGSYSSTIACSWIMIIPDWGISHQNRQAEGGISVRLAKELKDYDADANILEIKHTEGAW